METPIPSQAELESVTAGTLTLKSDDFYRVMENPRLSALLTQRLAHVYRSEGLEFFTAVLERNRTSDRKTATKKIVRDFVLDNAPRQVNMSSEMRNAILKACLSDDDSQLCAEDLFKTPALQACAEIARSKEFDEFVKEYIN